MVEAARANELLIKARHTDPVVADLCDQRDELLSILANSVVPGVKKVLQDSLNDVESKLLDLFPGAFDLMESTVKPNLIEELYYFFNSQDSAIFLLPIKKSTWKNLESGSKNSDELTRIMKLIWRIIKDFDIKQYQVVQTSDDSMVVKIIRGKTYNDNHTRELSRILEKSVGANVEVKVDFVEYIPPTESGKWKIVIRNVK